MIPNSSIQKLINKAQYNRCDNKPNQATIDIIIPVYNGFSALKKCFKSLIINTSSRFKLYFYNDASTDSNLKPWLDKQALQHAHVNIIHHNSNKGYLSTVNHAMLNTANDVVLLNSDTQVTPNWLEELSLVGNQASIAITCPLSDNASILSLDAKTCQNHGKLKHFSRQWYAIPTAVGSCMLIKRWAIKKFGVFDAFYHPGYGEECDYSFRIRSAGYHIACAPASFVFHSGSESFSEQAEPLKQQHQKMLDLRWPNYLKETQYFAENNPIQLAEETLNFQTNKNNVLHVVHGINSKGGVELFTKELLTQLETSICNTVLLPCKDSIPWSTVKIQTYSKNIRFIHYQFNNHKVASKINNKNADLEHKELDLLFIRQILSGNYDLVHFHSFVGIGSLKWPEICQQQGLPYLVSCHDHFPLCFNFALLTNKFTHYCRKSSCQSTDKECIRCINSISNYNSLSTAHYINARNTQYQAILKYATHVIVPHSYLQDKLNTHYKKVTSDKIRIIEPYFYTTKTQPQSFLKKDKPSVAYLGNFTYEKGAQLFLQAYDNLKGLNCQWHIIGKIHPYYHSIIKNKNIKTSGEYHPAELSQLLSNIDIVVLPSLHPEAYSITLTEAWQNNKAVIVPDIGALNTRVTHNLNGLIFKNGDSESLAYAVLQLCKDTTTLKNITQYITQRENHTLSPCEQLSKLYHPFFNKKPQTIKNLHNENVYLDKPLTSSYELMEQWLYSPMTLEAPADWSTATPIDIVLLGRSKYLYQKSLESCKTYANNCKIHITDSNHDLKADISSSIICFLVEGQLLNDNFGNWINNFVASKKKIGLADYALINQLEQIYAPQFSNCFDEFAYLRQKSRVGALLINKDQFNNSNNKKLLEVLLHSKPLNTLIDEILQEGRQNIHYFPHLSYLYFDQTWIKQWKQELTQTRPQNPSHCSTTVSILLLTSLKNEQIAELVKNILEQQSIALLNIYVFSSHYLKLKGSDKVSVHAIDFDSVDQFVNPIILRDKASSLIFMNDSIKINNENAFNILIESLYWHKIKAVSPILEPNSENTISEKLGNGFLSAKGIIRDKRFDLEQLPLGTQLLDEDFFLIDKSTLLKINGLQKTGNIYYRANSISSQLTECKLALVEVAGLTRNGLPSYNNKNKNNTLEQQREELFAQNKDFYLHSMYNSSSFTSRSDRQLDCHFGTFKTPKNLPRVIAYANDSWASAFYRIKSPLSALVAANKISAHFLPEKRQKLTATYFELNKQQPDVILLHNFFAEEQLKTLESYKKYLNVPLILSIDDLLTEIPHYNSYSQSNPINMHNRITKALTYADRLIVSTHYLKQKFSHLHEDIHVINNCLAKELWQQPINHKNTNTSSKVRIGWAGAEQHKNDLSWVKPIIEATQQELQWVFYGYMPEDFKHLEIEFHPHTPLSQYHLKLASLNLDIAIAPLENNSFNQAKSNLKLLEYGALSLPVICSPVQNYLHSPATITENKESAWIEAIKNLSQNKHTRIESGIKMRKWLEQNYFLEDQLETWLSALFIPKTPI